MLLQLQIPNSFSYYYRTPPKIISSKRNVLLKTEEFMDYQISDEKSGSFGQEISRICDT